MHLNAATPAESINKTYLNRPVSHTDFGTFSDAVEILAKRVSTSKQESEAHHKTWLRDFMQQIGYKDKYTINTCQNIDLAIFDSTDSNARVSIIFETKKPGSAEMCRPTDINKKALQEALLYYLRERIGTPLISEPNLGIKNIIITDLESWYIFDSRVFESAFIGDKSLTRSFIEFEQKALSATTTDVFYSEIAKPAIQRHLDELHHTFFKLSDLAKTATSKKSRSLVAACKFLSPQNLLRLPFENIGNTLNQGFYTELLHILGLEETRTKQKRVVIQRKAEGTRHAGSMLENVLQIVVSRALITNVKQISLYGNTLQEQQLSIALQLCITWLNRILFLKLLEGQLLRYDKQNAFPHFLGTQRISNYNDLEELFFDVLAVDISARSDSIKIKFPSVPYLNSSLFELTDLEKETVSISALKSSLHLPLYKNTVLRETTGKKATGSLPLVAYLLHFLDAYDFSTSVNDNSAINNKPIISASVLGLIFEKINNYQDGAFFTPAAVTSFMCRNTVRRAALRKINDHLGWECTNIIDVYNKVDQSNFSLVDNAISNIRICDPAVGSGHFLVSALNELLCLKSELNLLRFPDGKIFKGEIVSEGDELIVTDENGDVFNYDRRLSHSQKLQELIFSQKRLLIENCLFGVDLNPTSAHICRLRLWIELLKSSYYKGNDSSCALETLPNIDINIKTGNSLIRRFKLHSDVAHTINAKTAKAAKFSVDAYRSAVHDYTHAKLKSAKRTLAESISAIKENFVEEIRGSDDDVISLSKAREEYRSINGQTGFFSSSTSEAIRKKNIKRLEAQIARLEARISAVEQAEVFKHAFEWRFEFPEILNDTGDFVGFDAIVGNPPYGVRLDKSARDLLQRDLGKVPDFEIYYWFIALAFQLLREGGEVSYIIPNSILFNVYAKDFRLNLLKMADILDLVDCTSYAIFPDATVRNIILSLSKGAHADTFAYKNTTASTSLVELLGAPDAEKTKNDLRAFSKNWALALTLPADTIEVLSTLDSCSKRVKDYFPDISQGLIAYDKYTGQDLETIKNRTLHSTAPSETHNKKWLRGKDVRRFECEWNKEDYFSYCDEVANPRQPKFFRGCRILVREITNPTIFAAITGEECYNDPSLLIILENKDGKFPIYALLGILNSYLMTYYHFKSSPKATKGAFPKILISDISNFPLPDASRDEISEIEKISRALSKRNPSLSAEAREKLESELNKLVFRAYNLPESGIGEMPASDHESDEEEEQVQTQGPVLV